MTFEELIKVREENNLTKSAFASLLGITAMLEGRYESGKLNIPDSIAEKVKELFSAKKEKPSKKTGKASKASEAAAPKKQAETKASGSREKAKAAAPKVFIQSLLGGSITPEEVLSRVPADVEAVYIKPEENKAYWVKGDEGGDLDLW